MSTPLVQIQVLGTEELIKRLVALGNLHKSPRMRALFEDAGMAYVVLAQQDAPKDTRELKSGIHHRVTGFGTQYIAVRIGVQGPAARYARFVEEGTKPSVRFPRNRRWMHWYQDAAGKTLQIPYGLKDVPAGARSIFAKKVHHPGTPARPFFFKHMPVIRGRLLAGIDRLMAEALSGQQGPSS
jgi:HK97 gp10 family phage protein